MYKIYNAHNTSVFLADVLLNYQSYSSIISNVVKTSNSDFKFDVLLNSNIYIRYYSTKFEIRKKTDGSLIFYLNFPNFYSSLFYAYLLYENQNMFALLDCNGGYVFFIYKYSDYLIFANSFTVDSPFYHYILYPDLTFSPLFCSSPDVSESYYPSTTQYLLTTFFLSCNNFFYTFPYKILHKTAELPNFFIYGDYIYIRAGPNKYVQLPI